MFKIADDTRIRFYRDEKPVEAVAVWEGRGDSYVVRHADGIMENVPTDHIFEVLVHKVYVVSWVLNGKPGSRATFDLDVAQKLSTRHDKKGASVWQDTHSLGCWVAYN